MLLCVCACVRVQNMIPLLIAAFFTVPIPIRPSLHGGACCIFFFFIRKWDAKGKKANRMKEVLSSNKSSIINTHPKALQKKPFRVWGRYFTHDSICADSPHQLSAFPGRKQRRYTRRLMRIMLKKPGVRGSREPCCLAMAAFVSLCHQRARHALYQRALMHTACVTLCVMFWLFVCFFHYRRKSRDLKQRLVWR